MHMRPDIFASTNVDGFAELDGQPDRAGDLLRVGLLKTFLDEGVINKAPNCGREDDPGSRISYAR